MLWRPERRKIEQGRTKIMSDLPINEFDILKVDPKAGLKRGSDDGFTREGPKKMEDTFWPGKKALITQYNKILELDERALKAPHNLRNDPRKLVDHLQQFATSVVEKYRVIFRWITAFVSFGQRGQRVSVTNLNEAIAKGVSAPGVIGLATIFKEMCSLADLPCKTVSGSVRMSSFDPRPEEWSDHTWNVIELCGMQYYCDIAWASGGILKNAIGRVKTMVREFHEEYFLAEPDQFTSEHLPTQDGKVLDDLQFGTTVFSSIDAWSSSKHNGSMMPTLGINMITTKGTVVSINNTCQVQLRCPRGLRLWHHLRRQPDNENGQVDNHVMQFWRKNVVSFRIKLPAKGKYTLTIYGAAEGIKEELGEETEQENYKVFGVVTTYTIIGDGEIGHPALPKEGVYGVLPKAISAGYYCVSHTEPIVETSSNKLTFEFACPAGGNVIPNLFHEGRPNLKIIDSIYREPFSKKTALHLALSKPGRYCLEVYAPYQPKLDTGVHSFAARFLIVCSSNEKASFFADPNPWGPNEDFPANKLTCLDVPGSTIHAKNGKGCITFTNPIIGGDEITYNLLAPGVRGTWKEIPNYRTWIFAEVIDRKRGLRFTRFNFRIPERGFYQFLFGYGGKFMGRWLVACPVVHTGDLFPIREGVWGPSRKMAEVLGMRFSHPVRFTASGGEVDVAVEIPPHLPDWHVFAHLKDVEGPRLMLQSKDISRISDSSRKDWRAVTFTLKLPTVVKTAILTLSIGQEKSKDAKVISTTNEGYWLVTRI